MSSERNSNFVNVNRRIEVAATNNTTPPSIILNDNQNVNINMSQPFAANLGDVNKKIRGNFIDEDKIEGEEEDDDDENFTDGYNEDLNVDFDEKDELDLPLNAKLTLNDNNNNFSQKSNPTSANNSIKNDSSSMDDNFDENEIENIKMKTYVQVTKSSTSANTGMSGKSTFYFPSSDSLHNSESNASGLSEINSELLSLPKCYFDEKFIFSLKNVNCLFSSSTQRVDVLNVYGKLLLTNYRLVFLPYLPQQQSEESFYAKLFLVDKNLQLFNHSKIKAALIIPYSFIYEMRVSTVTSDKYKKIKAALDPSSPIARDLVIKCKNFLTKCFIFNEPSKHSESIIKLMNTLVYYSNYNNVIHSRFHNLINKLNTNKELLPKEIKSLNQQQENESENSEPNTRRSFLIPNDLQQTLIELKCDEFIHVKPGTMDLKSFNINTNMPYFAMTKSINDLILRKRVVLNESNVYEFISQNNENFANRQSTLSISSKTSPRGTKGPTYNPNQYQNPLIANSITSNPFYDNKFPIWSYTHPITRCSLIIVPEAHANRQDDAEIIIKNYNSFLCDQVIKEKKLQPNTVSIFQVSYCDYEFFKFQVPFGFAKISSSFLKLMDMCCFRTIAEYEKEYEKGSFYSRLNSAKWLRHVSSLLSLTSRIVNSLFFFQRNVFLEEMKNNNDCSCIISSLVKICLSAKYRTIVGLDDLIQSDWFLTGHMFNKRFLSPAQVISNSDEYVVQNDNEKRRNSLSSISSVLTTTNENVDQPKSNGGSDIAPTFLLFLDCVFQLTIQYPTEFEFNEIYLINLWDYSCSGLSFTYSFNGVADWLVYLKNQNFFDGSNLSRDAYGVSIKGTLPKFENIYLKYLFDTNNLFWITHLSDETTNTTFLNKSYTQTDSMRNDQVLLPNDRIYMLKFWSRCYMRWNEKLHAYNSSEQKLNISNQTLKTNDPCITQFNLNKNFQPTRPAPLPPTIKKLSPVEVKNPISDIAIDDEKQSGVKNASQTKVRNENNEIIEELTSF